MKRLVLILGLTALCAMGGTMLYLNRTAARTAHDKEEVALLTVPAEKLQFGPVWEDEAFEWVLPVSNTSDVPVQVESVAASCSCAAIEPRSFVVPARGEVELRLKINLLVKQPADGRMVIAIMPNLKREENARQTKRIQWDLEGTVKKCLRFEQSVFLKKQSDMAIPLKPWTIPVESLEPLESISASCDVAELKPAVRALDVTGMKFELTLTPPQEMAARMLEGNVVLTPVLQGGEKLPARRMKMLAQIAADAVAEPPEVLAGGHKRGEIIEDTIAIRSLTNRAWKVESVSAEGQGLKAERLDDGRVRVKQVVSMSGTQQNVVRVTVTLEGRKFVLTVPVTYTGHEVER